MANHNLPTLTDTYSNFLNYLNSRLDDLALGLSNSTTVASNLPTNSIRWNSTNRYWEINTGTKAAPSWSALSTTYAININGTVGSTTPAAGTFTSLTVNTSASLPLGSTVNASAIINASDIQTLNNKTLTTPRINDTSSNHTYNFAVSELVANRTITLPLLGADDTFVFQSHAQTLSNKTLTSPRFASAGDIADQNGNELIKFSTAVSSAVNELNISNSATGASPTLSVSGGDANIDLILTSKGTGVVKAGGTAASNQVATLGDTQTLSNKTLTTPRINDTSSNHTYNFAVSELAANRTITLPLLGADDTFVFQSHTQTLTNKTISSSSTWQGNTVAVNYGGTGTATSPSQGGIIYGSTASAYASTAAGSTGQFLFSNGTSAPTWSTFDLATNFADINYKKRVDVATTQDLQASSFSDNSLYGYPASVVLNVTTTAGSATCTTTDTSQIRVGAQVSGNSNIPSGLTVASIVNATTFTLSAGTGVLAGTVVSTTFTQNIATLTIDGTVFVAGARILVKDTASLGGITVNDAAKYNGIYTVIVPGSATVPWQLTRATDADTNTKIAGAIVVPAQGTQNAGIAFKNRLANNSILNTAVMYWSRVAEISASYMQPVPVTAVGTDQAIETRTQQYVGGNIADFAVSSIGRKTILATSASTYTRASSLYIAGPPAASTNVTITTPYALYVATGNSYLDGTLVTNSTINGLTLASTSISSASATALTIDSGTTGALNFGTGANAKTITIGNSTGATAVDILTGTGNLDITSSQVTISGDLTVSGGDIVTAAATISKLFGTTTTGNVTIAEGLTTGTFTAGATGSTGAVSLFPATGAQNIGLGVSTTGTITIGGTSATAVQLPTGKTKIGNTTLVQGGAVSITLPTLAGTLYASGNTDVALADGGTNASLTASAGGVVYSTTTAMAITSAGTAGQILTSAGTSAPVWVTTLPIANGGTNASTADAARVNLNVITGTTGSERVPAGTTGQRDASPNAGFFRFNTTIGKFEGHNGSNWGSVGGGATGGGPDEIFIENGQAVTTNYSISTGKNAMTTGPVVINAGVQVTIPSGSRWVVL